MTKIFLFILIILYTKNVCGQITSNLNGFSTMRINGYDYDKENEFEPNLTQDTFLLPIYLPFKKSCKIFYDKAMKKIATEIAFDTVSFKIVTKHYNRNGKLVKELKCWVSSDKYNYKYDPLKPSNKNLEFLKTYHLDSLIYETIVIEGNFLINYSNPFSKVKFKKRKYFAYGYVNTEVVWSYYPNNNLKSICNIYWEYKYVDGGNEVIETLYDCVNFNRSGCLIEE